MIVVDTAALAKHLGCTVGHVRVLVWRHRITPIGRWALNGRGRPSMWFDLDQVDRDLGRVDPGELDHGGGVLRK